MPKVALAAAVLTTAVLSGGWAQAATYSSALFFGDSLSDDGNLFELTSAVPGGPVPPPPYFEGRTSNGPVWAEHIAADFAKKGLYSANYAYAFGQAVTNVDTQFGPLQVPDLQAQIGAFKASGAGGLLGDRPVATIWIGNNDLFTADPTKIALVAAQAASAVAGGIEALAEAGIDDVVVFNMVPLEKTPRFTTLGTPIEAFVAKLGVDTFNATLDGLLAGFGGGDPKVTKIDIHAAMTDLIENPGNYGVSDVTTPCYNPNEAALPCTAEEAAKRAFFDPVHPTGEIHAAIAELVRAEIAPIPLPAPVFLLLAGMAGLGAVGARRRRG